MGGFKLFQVCCCDQTGVIETDDKERQDQVGGWNLIQRATVLIKM